MRGNWGIKVLLISHELSNTKKMSFHCVNTLCIATSFLDRGTFKGIACRYVLLIAIRVEAESERERERQRRTGGLNMNIQEIAHWESFDVLYYGTSLSFFMFSKYLFLFILSPHSVHNDQQAIDTDMTKDK